MHESFASMLTVGGKSNSLGRVNEVISLVLQDKSRLKELYGALFDDDAWVRMRAADALEKVCRQHPEWIEPYIDRFASELSASTQPSIQWHLAQMYRQVTLTDAQRRTAAEWLAKLIATTQVDWIVAANAMTTLAEFTDKGWFTKDALEALLAIQQQHTSKSVVRRANKIRAAL